MKKVVSTLMAVAALSMLSMSAQAAAPIQFSFFDFNAPKDTTVKGVRFSVIYGKSGSVTGVDFPILSISHLDSLKGVSFPLFLPGASIIESEMTGVTFGVFTLNKGNGTGVNFNVVNLANNTKGANVGAVNWSQGNSMVDLFGFVNKSGASNFQLGWVNITNELNGVQIGLVSCAKNGFLPCFILFNFGFTS